MSWDRNCPEFTKRCGRLDERNPENEMPYFPTEQDWTQTERPTRIPPVERFPGTYTVNSLPLHGAKQAEKRQREQRGRSRTAKPRSASRQGPRPLEKGNATFPNTIPVSETNKPTEVNAGQNTTSEYTEQHSWVDDIEEQFISQIIGHEPTAANPPTKPLSKTNG